MNTRKLRLVDLHVESFETSPSEDSTRGSVRAHDRDTGPTDCVLFTCAGQTCGGTCGGAATCVSCAGPTCLCLSEPWIC